MTTDATGGVAGADGSLADLVDARAERTPASRFAVDERDRELTFAQLRRQSEALAAALIDLGVSAGQVVSWQMPTWIDTAVLAVALDRIGVTQNPLLASLRRHDLSFICGQVGSDWLLTPGPWRGFDHHELAQEVAAGLPGLSVATIERDRPPDAAATASLPPRRPVDTAWIFYTSGTSGLPKGVRHGHSTVISATRSMVERMEVTATDRSVIGFPFAHIGGINWLMASAMSGCGLILLESFGDPSTMEVIRRHGGSLLGVTTAFHLAYLAAQRADDRQPLFPAVRAYPGGAAPKPPGLHHDLVREVGGVGIVSGYGLTESPMNAMASVRDPAEKLATTEGRPSLGVDVRTIGPDGREVATGGDGELRVRGAHLFQGYVDPELDGEAFDAEGWFRTGDLGHLDEDGYVVVTGRLKDVIVRKGENVSAKEIEDLLFDHPAIADVAVIGLPDPERGERVCAVVVARAGAVAPDLGAVTAYLHERGVMVQKHPEQVEIMVELPRNAGGKVQKAQLRETCLERSSRTGDT